MTQQKKRKMGEKPWWNRPIMGDKSIGEQLTAMLFKPEVPRKQIVEHDIAMQEAEKLASFIATLDSEKFDNPEFALLVQTKHCLEREIPGYEGLKNSGQLLEAALQAKDSFLAIEEIEFQYRGFVQQKFYQELFQLLSQNLSQPVFLKMLERLAKQSQDKLKTEKGKIAIQTYVTEIKSLASKHQLGIQLLYDFKRNQFEDFNKLQKISNLIKEFHLKEVHNAESFLLLIERNYELFRDLGNIIKLPPDKDTVESYAILLQYLVLLDKHQRSYRMLEELLKQLQKWYKFYQTVCAIRKHYNSGNYKQPSAFKRSIPGLDLYQKYQPWLLQSIMKHHTKTNSPNNARSYIRR